MGNGVDLFGNIQLLNMLEHININKCNSKLNEMNNMWKYI